MSDDLYRQLEDRLVQLIQEFNAYRNVNPLENASIRNGRLRFVGGTLRVDSGGRVEIVGHLQIEGTTSIIGPVTISGLLNVTGEWRFFGNGAITGDVVAEGKWTQNGDWEFNGDGDIAGDVDVTGNVNVTGAGRITAGDAVLKSGELTLSNGAKLKALAGISGMVMESALGKVVASVLGAELQGGTTRVVASVAGNVLLKGTSFTIDALPVAGSINGLSWVGVDASGNLWKVPQGVGGPIGGPLRWPFPPDTVPVTSEYGPRESPGEGGSTFHEGIDQAPGAGTPIPAAGSGTVELAGTNGGFGNCVIINHGGGLKTLYGHMQSTPLVSVGSTVTAGQIIGAVGNTGVSFGAHLHFEVHVNGSPVNPRTKLP